METTYDLDDDFEGWDWDEHDWDLENLWDGPGVGHYAKTSQYRGVIFRIVGDNGLEYKTHMVGDDKEFIFDQVDMVILDDDESVCSCGQEGCGWGQ